MAVPSDDVVIGRTIRAIRESAGLQAKSVADEVGVNATKFSRWENGETRLRASELATLADALGVSPVAIIHPTSLLGRLAVSQRNLEGGSLRRTDLASRVLALSEFHQLFQDSGICTTPSKATKAPLFESGSWIEDAERLSQWAWTEIGEDLDGVGDARFDALVYAIEYALDVDVLVEPFDADGTLGLALTDPEFPLIVVNSAKPRRQALFTIAHELGHVLRSDGELLWGDESMAGNGSTSERFANAFAAAFLMPKAHLAELVPHRRELSSDVLGQLLYRFGVSVQTLAFRLHNLALVNAAERDRLRSLSPFRIAALVSDPQIKRRLAASDASPSYSNKPPQHLLNRAMAAYRAKVCSIGPVAGLLRLSDDRARAVVDATTDDVGTWELLDDAEHLDLATGPFGEEGALGESDPL
jgi:Zn-dependent peptidase ImmA (M78 family)/transcriptional regulator with XRE-family HTH domain